MERLQQIEWENANNNKKVIYPQISHKTSYILAQSLAKVSTISDALWRTKKRK